MKHNITVNDRLANAVSRNMQTTSIQVFGKGAILVVKVIIIIFIIIIFIYLPSDVISQEKKQNCNFL